jgi:cytochrome c-type biogenesis protein CcmE
MTRKQRRLMMIGIAGIVLVAAAGLVFYALSDRITFFTTPSDIAAKLPEPGQRVRLGGMVEDGSLVKTADGMVEFTVTDGAAAVPVSFRGLLPDLFREGQGVVTEGTVGPDGRFTADSVLAKHDETYMPREVIDALKEGGMWEGEGATERPTLLEPVAARPAAQ